MRHLWLTLVSKWRLLLSFLIYIGPFIPELFDWITIRFLLWTIRFYSKLRAVSTNFDKVFDQMSGGGVSIVFSEHCTETERVLLTSLFEHLDHVAIEHEGTIKGFAYRIGDFIRFLNEHLRSVPMMDAATQAGSIMRPASPSVFQNVASLNRLYEDDN